MMRKIKIDPVASPVTHPPLANVDLRRMQEAMKSPDATLLFREIERLHALEPSAKWLATTEDAAVREIYRNTVLRELQGRLGTLTKFGLCQAPGTPGDHMNYPLSSNTLDYRHKADETKL